MSANVGFPRREPVLLWTAVLTTLQIIVSGAAFADLIGAKLTGFAILVIGALQAGTGVYLRGVVTPVANPTDNQGNKLVRETAAAGRS
jgi:hypothetical protein